MSDTNDSPMNAWKKLQQAKRDGIKKKKVEPVYTDKEMDIGPKMAPITLKPMPEDQRDREKEKIFRDKMYLIADNVFKKLGDNAVEKGFLSKEIADDMIRAADSMHKWMLPIVDDTWTQGNWINAYPQFAEKIRDDYDLYEDPMMLRYRYKILKDGTVHNEHPYTKEHMVGTSLEKKFNIVAQIADNQPFDLFKLLWENDEKTRHQQILKREEKRSEDRTGKKKKKKVFKISDYTTDPEDYDDTLDIHGDIVRYPPKPPYFRNKDKNKEEYDRVPEAEALGLTRKDLPDDYTEFNQFIQEYQKTPKYKRQKAAYEHYKERLKTCKTKDDYLKALMDYKKETFNIKNGSK